MDNGKTPWFVAERSEALAGLLLTSHKGVKVRSKQKTEDGVDFLLEVEGEPEALVRLFAAQVRGTVTPDRAEWSALVEPLFRAGPALMPACVVVVNVRDNQAAFAWRTEPAVTDAGAKLNLAASPDFQELTLGAVEEVVERVNAWYDAFGAQCLVTRG